MRIGRRTQLILHGSSKSNLDPLGSALLWGRSRGRSRGRIWHRGHIWDRGRGRRLGHPCPLGVSVAPDPVAFLRVPLVPLTLRPLLLAAAIPRRGRRRSRRRRTQLAWVPLAPKIIRGLRLLGGSRRGCIRSDRSRGCLLRGRERCLHWRWGGGRLRARRGIQLLVWRGRR